jgi:hypothetical protein
MLHPSFHNGFIDKSMDSIKRTFSILSLLKAPVEYSEEYSKYINSSKNAEVEVLLEQPSEKRSAIKKEVYIKGKQDTIEDVISFIANIFVFARFWVKMEEDSSTHPLVIQIINEVADLISSSDFREFYEVHKATANWTPHTLVAYLFNIFSIFVKAAKKTHTVRRFNVDNVIKYEDVNLSSLMISSLIDQLRLCTATGSLQVLFASPTTSFKYCCPHLTKLEQGLKRPRDNDKTPEGKKVPKDSKGSIINTTGKRLTFPSGLEGKYCSDFLDTKESCTRGEGCKFTHAVFPSGFIGEDAKVFREYVEKTPGLAFSNKHVAEKKVSA